MRDPMYEVRIFLTTMLITLISFKALHLVDMPWWFVLLPIWVPLALCLLLQIGIWVWRVDKNTETDEEY